MSGGQTARLVELICDFEPDIVMVTPSYMLSLLDEFRARGIDPRSTSLKIGIFGAEPWTEAMRAEVEQSFALDAVDIYGLSEVMGPGVAQEYGATKDGPTIWEDHFYPEVVDPDSGAVLPDGSEGELVFTSLTKQAMPVVRYRTRDLTRLLPGSVGPMRRMAKITGRTDDMLIVRGVNLFPSQIEEQILRCAALSPHYRIDVERPQRLDEVTVHVEAKPDAAPDRRQSAAAELRHHIKSVIGVSVAVNVCEPLSLERSAGKAHRVRDLRPKG
jgi:phenylacetate-CoA ligase